MHQRTGMCVCVCVCVCVYVNVSLVCSISCATCLPFHASTHRYVCVCACVCVCVNVSLVRSISCAIWLPFHASTHRYVSVLSCTVHHKILVYKTHTVLETLLYRVFGTSSGDTHASFFLNSYGSLNISDSGQTRRVICQTFCGMLVGLQLDLVQR